MSIRRNFPNKWVVDDSRSISIYWNIIPFETCASFVWRDVVIHLYIRGTPLSMGEARYLTFIHNNKITRCNYIEYRYGGSMHRDAYPAIITSTHRISFSGDVKSLILRDQQIHSLKVYPNDDELPFRMIKTPSYIDFQKASL
jgi:hypothetical protein